MALLTWGCDRSDIWGTEQYFERIVGVRFQPITSPIHCASETGTDVVAFAMIQVPEVAVQQMIAHPLELAAYPKQLTYEKERTLRTWRRDPFSTEAQEAFDLALAGAIAAIQQSQCEGAGWKQLPESIKTILKKNTTYYMYQFKAFNGKSQVLPEALEFRVLDTANQVLYELVNFS